MYCLPGPLLPEILIQPGSGPYYPAVALNVRKSLTPDGHVASVYSRLCTHQLNLRMYKATIPIVLRIEALSRATLAEHSVSADAVDVH